MNKWEDLRNVLYGLDRHDVVGYVEESIFKHGRQFMNNYTYSEFMFNMEQYKDEVTRYTSNYLQSPAANLHPILFLTAPILHNVGWAVAEIIRETRDKKFNLKQLRK